MNLPQFTIQETRNYSSLKHYVFNRQINKANLNKIRESIQREGLKIPIAVTSDGYIYDGQHRFNALRSLGLPIHYIVNHNATASDIFETNNIRRSWSITDYVYNQANLGDLDCQRLLELYDEWKPNFTEGIINNAYFHHIGGGGSVAKAIKEKNFKIDENIGSSVLENAMLISEQVDKAKSSNFTRALKSIMMRNEKFDIKRLLSNMNKKKLNVYNNEPDNQEEIINVYNLNLKKANRVS